jgi:hypothetical protein
MKVGYIGDAGKTQFPPLEENPFPTMIKLEETGIEGGRNNSFPSTISNTRQIAIISSLNGFYENFL